MQRRRGVGDRRNRAPAGGMMMRQSEEEAAKTKLRLR